MNDVNKEALTKVLNKVVFLANPENSRRFDQVIWAAAVVADHLDIDIDKDEVMRTIDYYHNTEIEPKLDNNHRRMERFATAVSTMRMMNDVRRIYGLDLFDPGDQKWLLADGVQGKIENTYRAVDYNALDRAIALYPIIYGEKQKAGPKNNSYAEEVEKLNKKMIAKLDTITRDNAAIRQVNAPLVIIAMIITVMNNLSNFRLGKSKEFEAVHTLFDRKRKDVDRTVELAYDLTELMKVIMWKEQILAQEAAEDAKKAKSTA